MNEKELKALQAEHSDLKNRDDAVKRTSTALQRWQALGRLPKGQLNNTEKAFAAYLEERQFSGAIVWWKAHPFNFLLANNTFYRVDFISLGNVGFLTVWEDKGTYTSDKGQMKIKLCSEALPVFKMVKVTKLKGNQWKFEDF